MKTINEKNFYWPILILCFFLIVLGSCEAQSEEKNITWQTPTERIDGTPLSSIEIIGYDLRYGSLPEKDKYKWVGFTPDLIYSIELMNAGKYCFQGRTVLVGGVIKSEWSKEACTEINSNVLPKPPNLNVN